MVNEAENEREIGFIRLDVVVTFDREVGRFVAGATELDVWSSGSTELEALQRVGDAVELFLNTAEEMGTVDQILAEANVAVQRGPVSPKRQNLIERVLRSLKAGEHFPLTIPRPATPRAA